MTAQAQNAFLKTLEEPPSFAVFILIIEDEENLLQTVRSRCITVRFPRVGNDTVRRYISEKYPDCKSADFLVRYADGIPGSVDAVLAEEGFDELRHDAFDALARVMSPRRLDAYEAAEFLDKHKDKVDLILDMWIDFVRDMILFQHDCDRLAVNTDFLPRLTRAANTFEESETVRIQERLITAVKMHKRYVNLRAMTMWLAL
jgi:DNA polymerase-3 subunit delta'